MHEGLVISSTAKTKFPDAGTFKSYRGNPLWLPSKRMIMLVEKSIMLGTIFTDPINVFISQPIEILTQA